MKIWNKQEVLDTCITVQEYLENNNYNFTQKQAEPLKKLLQGKILYSVEHDTLNKINGNTYAIDKDRIYYLHRFGTPHDFYQKLIVKDEQGIINSKMGYGTRSEALYFNKLYIINEFKMTKKEQIEAKVASIKKEIEQKQKESLFEQGKLVYMSENNLTEFDENEYKVYHAIKSLDSKASTYEKAKLIAEIIKSK